MSETVGGKELFAALAKAQAQMRSAKKDSTNPHFKSKYADLASIWDACRDPLTSNGLAVMQPVTTNEDGVCVTTILTHVSGEFISSGCTFPVATKTPQAYGSAITYARRYSLASIVGIASDDDDGEESSGRAAAPRPPQPTASKPEPKKLSQAAEDLKAKLEKSIGFQQTVPSAFEKIRDLGENNLVNGKDLSDMVRKVCGPKSKEELTIDDYNKMIDAFEQTSKQQHNEEVPF